MNKFKIFIIQFLGGLWYLSLFVIIMPYLLVLLSGGLDFYVFESVLSLEYAELVSIIPPSIIILLSLVVLAFGFVIIIESIASMYHEAKQFPFNLVNQEELTPTQLINASWYSRVRHPMLLGYLFVLIGLGIYTRSISMIVWWVPLLGGLMLEYSLMVEEKQLVRWFGKEYEEYMEKVPPLLPSIRKQ